MKTLNFFFAALTIVALSGCATHQSDFRTIRDVAYVAGGGERQSGDLYLPKSSGKSPAALVIHGGGWTRRDRGDMANVAERLATRGIAAYNINYRLAPEYNHPTQLEDVHAALRYLKSRANELNLDTERFIMVGYSAGAHLALLATELPDPQAPAIRGVIAGGSPVDLRLYPKSPFINKLMGVSAEKDPAAWRAASPINHVDSTHPPVFLYHAQWDKVVGLENAYNMQAELERAGVSVALDKRYFIGHLILGIWQRPSIDRGIEFLKEVGAL